MKKLLIITVMMLGVIGMAQEVKPTFEKMELCYRLLQKIKEEGKLKVWIPISDLTRKGFDPNIPSTRLKDKKTGAEYMVLINFAYRVSDEGTKIIIVELNN